MTDPKAAWIVFAIATGLPAIAAAVITFCH